MTIRVGLIGFGVAGRYFHAPLLTAAGVRLQAVVTSRRDEVRTLYPDATVVTTHSDLVARDDVDLVVIASPSHLHYEHARLALGAGKHVIVDKPASASVAEVEDLDRVARARGVKFAVFQNRRWDADFLTIQQLLREDRLGEITSFRARWDRFRPEIAGKWLGPPSAAGDMVYDLGSHLIDQALCLFGRPDWIQADVFAQRRGATIDDTFDILMGKGPLRISLAASCLAAPGDWRYVIHGSQKSFFKPGIDPQEDQSRAGLQPLDARFGIEAASLAGTLVAGATGVADIVPSMQGRWLTFYERMKQSIEEDVPVPVGAADAAAILEIIAAAHRSSSEGRRIPLL